MPGVVTLRAEALSKAFGARSALRDVSFELTSGERVAVIGPNGAGKTTLLSLLAGLQRATGGSVSLPPDQIGWVPQQTALYKRLSVRENLRLFARLERVADPDAAVDRALQLTGLADRAKDELSTLSGGNQQRVNIAIGLLADPPVLLLDEPSSSLDPRQRAILWEFIDGLADAGTEHVEVRELSNLIPATEEFCWNFVVGSGLRGLLAGLGPDVVAQVRRDFLGQITERGLHTVDATTLVGTAKVVGFP